VNCDTVGVLLVLCNLLLSWWKPDELQRTPVEMLFVYDEQHRLVKIGTL